MDLFTIRSELSKGKTIFDLPLSITYYARVSSEKDAQLNSLQNQISYYENYIKQNKIWTFVPGYIDEGISGLSATKRDMFLKMIDDAQQGKFDFIITKEISRFSRNTLDSILYTQELMKYGVGILFELDNINTLLPDSELRLTIMSSIAQEEVRKLSERVSFGMKKSIKDGVAFGPKQIYGYDFDKDTNKRTINESQADVVRLIFDMYVNQNLGVRRIEDELIKLGHFTNNNKHFSASTVNHMIKNPKYKGYYCGGKSQKIDYRSTKKKKFRSND